MLNFTIEEYGWTLQQAIDSPIIFALLLMRQKMCVEGKGGISLIDQQKIDTFNTEESWQQLVEENRKKLTKYK